MLDGEDDNHQDQEENESDSANHLWRHLLFFTGASASGCEIVAHSRRCRTRLIDDVIALSADIIAPGFN